MAGSGRSRVSVSEDVVVVVLVVEGVMFGAIQWRFGILVPFRTTSRSIIIRTARPVWLRRVIGKDMFGRFAVALFVLLG